MPHTKPSLRHKLKYIRDQYVRNHDVQALSQQLLEQFLSANLVPEGATLAGYWSVGSEIDTRLILIHFYTKGFPCALPVIQEAEWELIFREWAPALSLIEGKFNIPSPPSTQQLISPDILLVPLIAFDRQGNRLGMGGGYYDTSITHLRSFKSLKTIGLAFDCQESEFLPTQKGDQSLDYIVTPTRVIRAQP